MRQEALSALRLLISAYAQVSEAEWDSIEPLFQFRQIKKNELLLPAGSICKELYFIYTGALRVFFLDEQGEEHTFHFSLEGTFCADYESFLKQCPSSYAIQALEPTTALSLSLAALERLYTQLAQGEKLGRHLAEEYFFMFSNKIRAYYTQSPKERYDNFDQSFPGLLLRMPQHYIASYLNISSVHLSRLKRGAKR